MSEQIVNGIVAAIGLVATIWLSFWFAALVEPVYSLPAGAMGLN